MEVHWWIKDIAEVIKRTVSGIDLITDKNIGDYTELVYGRNTSETVELGEVDINDITCIIMPDDCGVKYIKLKKKNENSKRAFKVEKKMTKLSSSIPCASTNLIKGVST